MTKPKTLAFINNKGGVGKTTLACNLAYDLSERHGKSVLVLDLDPQCNATQLLLEEDEWADIIGNSKAYRDNRTILYPLSPFRVGNSAIKSDIKPVTSKRFKVDVLTGHPSLALIEDTLSTAWDSLRSGELEGALRTNWLTNVVSELQGGYDFVVVDVGPSLGALNRSIIIGTDYVVTPTGADLFSLYALENIADWISAWGNKYQEAMGRVLEEYREDIDDLGVDNFGSLRALYIGYTIQQYVTKSSSDGSRRGVKSYDFYRDQIPDRALKLSLALKGDEGATVHDLGTVPHMFSMVPLAQRQHAPIACLTKEDGLRGAQIGQQINYREQLEEIGDRLFDLLPKKEDGE